ncbi:hypothetical protein Glove_319g150 [Diversispora epigaea]|uniref:Crinkler effector protein N-terminal domain-containing protein n=1 Tax=Diversispora epigaea TaxID=1348612 RepID=A0A397HWP1_9GLOM|nr:hypothetical protein Glove_319g150 [Diversispora epigaea]
MVFCLVLGDAVKNAFVVDIKEDKTVSHLKDIIREKLGLDIPINGLELWSVNIPITKENKDTIIYSENIQELKGEELLPSETLNQRFYESASNIRIVVKTDQWHTNVSRNIANLHYQPRQQNGLGGTLLPLQKNDRSFEGIQLGDHDVSYRSEKISFLVKDLINEKVLLIRAPPYSGKTSLTQLIEHYLVSSSEYSKYRVIRVSMLWDSFVNWSTFGKFWKSIIGVDWIEWSNQCRQIPTILILDEIQMIYKQKLIINESNEASADIFWRTIKGCLQEISNIYIIMFGAYGYYSTNSAGLSTPVEIPPSKCKGLTDISFTKKELKEYVESFSTKYFKLNAHDILDFSEYIQKTTEGHVGLIFHILRYTKRTMERRIRESVLTWTDIFVYLNSHDFNWTIDECRASPRIKDLSDEQLKICEDVYLNGKFIFRSLNMGMERLVKSGILVVDGGYLYFSAPLISRSFFQQYYGSHKSAEIAPLSLYHFIVKIFTAMCNGLSGKILRETLRYGTDGSLLEQTFQKEFYKDWAIELLRDGKDMAKHSRFEPTREYKEIVKYAKHIAIIDIRNEPRKVRKLQKDFIYVSCSENYNAFKIECLDKEPLIVKTQD